MNQNFDDCGGAERNLSDGPGRSEETCCKQTDAREMDDRPDDYLGVDRVEDTLPSDSQCSEIERLAALKSGTAWINYTGSAFDGLWQNWIDNQDWDSMSWIFMEGAGGLVQKAIKTQVLRWMSHPRVTGLLTDPAFLNAQARLTELRQNLRTRRLRKV